MDYDILHHPFSMLVEGLGGAGNSEFVKKNKYNFFTLQNVKSKIK